VKREERRKWKKKRGLKEEEKWSTSKR
jgi:hypothetical protein